MRMKAGRPARWCWISLSIREIRPSRQGLGGDQQSAVGLAARVAGEPVEQVGQVRADLRVSGEQAEVLVQAGRLGVVVAGAHVAVAAQRVALLAYHQGQLAVGLQTDEAVHDMAAGLLQLARPLDVGVFVEAGLDLDQDEDLLAGLGGLDEGVDYRRGLRGAVQGLLDRQYVRVGGGLLQEGLHGRGERVVGVVQQHVPGAQGGEDVGRGRRLDLGEVAVGAGDELRVLQLGTVYRGDAEEAGEVQGSRQRVHLGLADLQLTHQQVEHLAVDGLLDLEAHRRPEAAPHELLLQGLEQVLGVVLLDLEVLVAGEPEGVGLQHLHAREELLQVRGDDVLQRDVPAGRGLQEAGQQRRHLHAGEVLVAADRVADDDGQVQRQPGDVREGVRGVHGQRGQHREDLLPEQGEQPRLLLLGQLAPADHVDALVREGGRDVLLEAGGVPGHELAGAGPDHLQHLAGLEPGGGARGHARGDTALQTGDPDHEELVQVAGEDRQEVRAFEQGRVRVLGELQDPLVEGEPAALPVEEATLRQLGPAGLRLLVPVEVGVDVGFQVGDRRGHRARAMRGYGAHGGLRLLDLCLGFWLAHEPIVPREEAHGRVGTRAREPRGPVSPGPLGQRRRL
ncbi:hypothetical protein QFZ74_002916 [Streptomyces sp. V3I7]|nr:hypothetical protein [Streptomyces sp. V3I7]